MKICFPFTGDTIGGSHISSIVTIKELLSLGYDIVVVVHDDGPLAKEFERQNIRFEKLVLPTFVSFFPRNPSQLYQVSVAFYRIFQFIRRKSIELVHTNDARMHFTWALPIKMAGALHVWHQRTELAPSRIGNLAIRSTDWIACISNYVVESLPHQVRRKSTVIPNPVGRTLIDSKTRHLYRENIEILSGVTGECLILGTIGNLREIKDPLTAVRAFGKMQQLWATPIILAVFGEDRDGYATAMMNTAREWGVVDRLLIMGFKRPIEPWLSACDVILAPSRGDAFGRTIIEAMQLGTPVIATSAGGHTEIVDHMRTGVLVQAGDYIAMATAAINLFESAALRNELITNGKQKARSIYSVESTTHRIKTIYEKLGS